MLRSRPEILLGAALVGVAAAVFAAAGARVPLSFHAEVLRLGWRLAGAIPVGLLAALLVAQPWSGLVAWLLVMPLLTALHIQVEVGAWQLLLPSILVPALAAGWLLHRPSPGTGEARLVDGRSGAGALIVAGAIVAVAAASTAGTADVARGIPIALHGLVEPALLAAVVVNLRPTRGQVIAAILAIGLSVVLATMVNLARTAYAVHFIGDWLDQRAYLARLTYYNVGIYGDVIVMALPLIASGAFLLRGTRWHRGARPLLWGGTGLLLVGLYLTFSKSAWIGALAAMLLATFLGVRTVRARLGLLVAGLAVSTLVVPWPSTVLQPVAPGLASAYQRVLDLIQPRSSSFSLNTVEGEISVTERIRATRAGLHMAVDHPLLGVGPGGFAHEYNGGPYADPEARVALDHPHNFPVDLLAETGFLMSGLVAAGFFAAAVASLAIWRSIDRLLGAGLFAALAGFLVVATVFGLDLYRTNRLMNADVMMAAMLVALPLALWTGRDRLAPDGRAAPSGVAGPGGVIRP